LNLVQIAFTSALKEVSDEVSKQLRSKEHNETAEYVLLYGKYETILENLGPHLEKLFKSPDFAFGRVGERTNRSAYADQYHNLYSQIVISYLKSREPVGPLVLKNLRKFAASDPKPDVDFESFARRSVQYVLDICHNEQTLVTNFFDGGPLLADYQDLEAWSKSAEYAGRLEENILSHLAALNTFLSPYLNNGDLQRICKLVNWLETIYMPSADGEMDADHPRDDRRSIAQALLSKYLWTSLDSLFIKAAADIEHFKPSQEDLKFTTKHVPLAGERNKPTNRQDVTEKPMEPEPTVLNAYPTVRIAVKLLVMYNEGSYDRPVRSCSITKFPR
jgi:hypothetical protein